jgi:hypothetical protein
MVTTRVNLFEKDLAEEKNICEKAIIIEPITYLDFVRNATTIPDIIIIGY